jgi:hypothetical protein
LPPPGDWRTWLVKAGRGFGKTRSGAEWVRMLVESGRARRVALVAPTAADARDVMVEGESGLLAVCPPWDRPRYEPSKRRLTWKNGAIATTYSADEPERLRGPNSDAAWLDELGSWRYPAAYHNLMFGLRLGDDPRVCVTMTPRPTDLYQSIRDAPTTVITTGSSRDNAANLAPPFLSEVLARYEGTRLGRQEIYAEDLEITEGAWFPTFDPARHVTALAEYDPALPVRLAIDCGTSRCTAAVLFQVAETPDPNRVRATVFADYYAEDLYAQANALAIHDRARATCGGRLDLVRLDPASSQRQGVGPVVSSAYEAEFGARRVDRWPLRPVLDGLDLIELMLAGPRPELTIHPRCTRLIAAFQGYRRDQRAGRWLDRPVDPQHPHEDLMDALRGGLSDRFPEGRRPPPAYSRALPAAIF